MLAPDYLADLIVLEQDPFSIDPHQLHTVQPVKTMVAGQWVWQSETG
jgi:predicted amidohydrolase YtcJ